MTPPALASVSGFTPEDLTTSLLIGSIVLLIAVAAVRLANRSGLPTLLIYLGLGLVVGESGFGLRFSDAVLTQVLGYTALVLILAEGGLTTQWSAIRRSVAPAIVLSTVGVLVSVAVVGVAAHYLLGLSWTVALLLGAITSSTDAAAVFSVLRRVPLPSRITGLLEAESGFNDAPVVLLVLALAEQAAPDGAPHPWWQVAAFAVLELAGGAAIGLVLGYAVGRVIKRVASGSSGLFSIGVLAIPVLAYAVADLAHTSGFIATYLSALVLGNLHLPHRQAVRGFAQALGWLAQIGLFVLLGLLASPTRLVHQIVPALVIGTVLLLLARPLSVLVSVPWFGIRWRERIFLSWAGLRGAVPVVLATVPLTLGTRNTEWIFDLVFVLVVVFTLVQAPTLPWVARRLGVVDESHTLDVELESTPLEELRAEVLLVRVGTSSQLHGVEVQELRLPRDADVTLVVREGHTMVPTRRTVLHRGDRFLIVTTETHRADVIRRIRAVSDEGRMAGWRRHGTRIDRSIAPPPRHT
ncbi:potassium/proton antiporter [Calidifontibacter sp. DB0510]|uniref:Potassium/proton antiporter n=1 Tax=Metallococcus carri TaxID=1656884 RepID=A0A967EGX2_9MICO|nr:potassium/proton antiporter [Metallococcus carri]NHN55638.1 potassium/proton antiporter [Metallococcus carri]NOP38178.1 potassium/proton antiporter [Calidifontibacter sp. DB2511S]